MIELKKFIERKDDIIQSLMKRNFGDRSKEMVDDVIALDHLRKETQTEADEVKSKFNKLSKEIGHLYKTGKSDEANILKEKNLLLKDRIKFLEEKLKNTLAKLDERLLSIPNICHHSVPSGSREEDNEIFLAWPEALPLTTDLELPHWELAKKYDIIDFEKGAFVTGSGFPFYKGKGAKLQRALIQFFLDEAASDGYIEYQTPLMVNEASARGTGQLPDKEGQMYHMEKDNLYMIPTAEVSLTNLYRSEIVTKSELPVKITAHSPCFRREAGSYGADVKGLNRLHQFDKVEIVQIADPDVSYKTLDEMVKHVQNILIKLELPYRILRLCGGDLGFTSALTYDFEVFSGAQQRWLEVSSVSNFETFQSNRMNIRYRSDDNGLQLVHTLNGSALALPRVMAALLENNQDDNGILVPEVLRSYTGFERIS